MFEIRCDAERLEGFIGKLLREELSEAVAKLLAAEILRGELKFLTHKFKAIGLGAAKALHGEHQAIATVLRDGKYAARQVVMFRPEVQ